MEINKQVLDSIVTTSRESASYATFKAQPSPESPTIIYFNIYAWNVTNPHEVAFQGAKPNLDLLGPYSYIEHQNRINATFDVDGNYVDFYLQKYYVWNNETSCDTCFEEDVFTTSYLTMQVYIYIYIRYIYMRELERFVCVITKWVSVPLSLTHTHTHTHTLSLYIYIYGCISGSGYISHFI